MKMIRTVNKILKQDLSCVLMSIPSICKFLLLLPGGELMNLITRSVIAEFVHNVYSTFGTTAEIRINTWLTLQ